MTSVSAGHTILTLTQPVGSRRQQRESNPGPPHQESHALPTELAPPRERDSQWESMLQTWPGSLKFQVFSLKLFDMTQVKPIRFGDMKDSLASIFINSFTNCVNIPNWSRFYWKPWSFSILNRLVTVFNLENHLTFTGTRYLYPFKAQALKGTSWVLWIQKDAKKKILFTVFKGP